MNLKNLFAKLSLVVVLLTFFAANAFAQVYVSNTNGNDITGTGSQLSPYKTILKGYQAATTGQTVYIDADTYNEGAAVLNLNLAKNVTFEAVTFNAGTTVTITNGVTVNPGAAYTITFGVSGQKFNFGTVNPLTLTTGTLVVTSQVTIPSGATIVRSGGAMSGTPTFGANINVTYTGNTKSVGTELPASLGTGTLTVNLTAGQTLSVASALSFTDAGKIDVQAGHATFSGNVAFSYATATVANAITNSGVNTVTFDGAVTFTRSAAAHTITLQNTGALGKLLFTNGFVNNNPSIASGIQLNLSNTNTGTIELGASSTLFGNLVNSNAAGIIKLNSNQLTLSHSAGTINNVGNIVSGASSTVGGGYLLISGVYTALAGGQLPNVSVSGKLTLPGAVVPVYGDFTLSSATASALDFVAGSDLEIWGSSFNRTNNTPLNVDNTVGVLTFRGALAQSFTPGASLELFDMVVNKTAGTVVTLGASIVVKNNLTIGSGTLNIGDFNLNLQGTPSTFTNNGLSTSGNGYIVFEGGSGVVTGTGQFGNILVNLTNAAAFVSTGSSVKLSGILYINKGGFDVAAGAHTVTFNNALVANPTIKINTTLANTAAFTNSGLGTITNSANVNLYYFGADNYTAGIEWTGAPTKLNDVTIDVAGTKAVTSNNNTTINGTLTVNGNTTLTTANTFLLVGDGKTHLIAGTVGGTLEVRGNGSAVNGTTSTAAGFNGAVNNLSFEPADNSYSFASTNLKTIGGNLTLQGVSTKTGATATVTMNATTSTLTGNLAVGNGTLGPVASVTVNGSTTSVFGGDVALTDGTLTLTRGGNSTVVGGSLTATKGTLILGSNVLVDGTGAVGIAQAAGNIDLNGKKLTLKPSVAFALDYNRTGTGTLTNGTIVFDATTQAIDVAPGATFVMPNVESIGTGNGLTFNAALEIAGTLLLDNASTTTQAVATVLTYSGSALTVSSDAGAFTGAITFKGADATLSLGQNYAFPTMVLNSTGTLTVVNGTAGAKTLTVGTAYTNTTGNLALGINTLDVATAFTWSAGTLTQGTGYLNLNVANPSIPATGFSVDNLKIYTTAADFTIGATVTPAFTVVKNLVLAQSLTTSADGKLTLGDGCLVERQDNTYILSHVPAFGANTDVKYSTYALATNISTAKELPATVRNVTVLVGAGALKTVLTKNITVTGTLSLSDMFDATTTASTAITMADGSTLELKVNGTAALDEDLTKSGAMHLIYNGATATTTRELGDNASASYPAFSGNVTVKTTVTATANGTMTGAATTWNGTFTFDGGNFDQFGFDVNIGGSVATTANGGNFVNGAVGSAFLNLTGATNTNLSLGADWAIPANIKFRLNKTNNNNTVTLSGGNLDFSGAGRTLYFKNGILVTGTKVVILRHIDDGLGNILQGFDRTAVTGTNISHVSGNVKKYLDATNATYGMSAAVALTRVEFPVGSTTYKPMAFQFNTLPTANFNLTVNEVEANPAGTNGFPITSGSIQLANYPGFYWLVSSDLTLQPQVKYDIEAEAYGYAPTNYPEGVQNVRFLRRFDTDVNNPWVLQGGLGYDNATNVDHAKIIVRSAEGAISTQGARFTYSQAAKAPTVTTPAAAVTVAENVALTVAWTKASQNLGGTATFESTPVWTATAPAVVPTNATFDAASGTLTWTPTYTQAGVYTIKVKAIDGILSTENTVTITVTNANQVPSFVATGAAVLADATIPYGTAKTFTYVAKDGDNETLTYAVNVAPVPAGTVSISNAFGSIGLFSFTPTFADNGKVFVVTVTATDPNAGVATTTANLTVGAAYKRGDATLSGGEPDVTDAIKVLEHVVGKVTLTAEQLVYADANLDATVGAVDASWILKYIANNYSWVGVSKVVATAGTVEFSRMSAENGVLNLPFAITSTTGVTSIYAEADLNNANIEVGKVNLRLPEGWLAVTSTENGKVRIAAAGVNAINDGIFATVEVTLKDKETAVSIVGNAKLNDEISSSLNAKVREIPSEFALSQNYPNPFNPTTSIKFSVAQDAKVNLVVYDMLGQRVRTLVDGVQEAGFYTVRWDGSNDFGSKVASGIYIYRLQAGSFVSTMKMNLMK